jgi:hypothetical protein
MNKYKFVGGIWDGEYREVDKLLPVLYVPQLYPTFYTSDKRDLSPHAEFGQTHKYYHRVTKAESGELIIEYIHDSVYKVWLEKEDLARRTKEQARDLRKRLTALENL